MSDGEVTDIKFTDKRGPCPECGSGDTFSDTALNHRCRDCKSCWVPAMVHGVVKVSEPTPARRLKDDLIKAFGKWLGDTPEGMERQIWRIGCFSQFMDEAARIFTEHGFGAEDE